MYRVYALGLLLIIPVLLFLGADYFDNGPSRCLSVVLFDMECYGCGMTRAVQHLIHFDFAKAAEYNKLSFIVAPLLLYIWVKELIRVFRILR